MAETTATAQVVANIALLRFCMTAPVSVHFSTFNAELAEHAEKPFSIFLCGFRGFCVVRDFYFHQFVRSSLAWERVRD
jgi:hypothetical protein